MKNVLSTVDKKKLVLGRSAEIMVEIEQQTPARHSPQAPNPRTSHEIAPTVWNNNPPLPSSSNAVRVQPLSIPRLGRRTRHATRRPRARRPNAHSARRPVRAAPLRAAEDRDAGVVPRG
jgi:hypothetical protein